MKITKTRLKEIIKEELSEMDLPKWEGEPFGEYDLDAENEKGGLGDLQSDEKFTGGSPEEQMLRRIKARELLAAMSKEELKELSLSLDAETVAELRHLLANPMYAPMEEGITPGVQQLMKHYPHAAAKIKKLAGNGYRANEIKRMLNLGYRG